MHTCNSAALVLLLWVAHSFRRRRVVIQLETYDISLRNNVVGLIKTGPTLSHQWIIENVQPARALQLVCTYDALPRRDDGTTTHYNAKRARAEEVFGYGR